MKKTYHITYNATYNDGDLMADTSEFIDIIKTFHRTKVIEDSKGTKAEKDFVWGSRKAAEKQAFSVLTRKWGEWSDMDLTIIIENVNWNGFDDKNKRFSIHFLTNLDRIGFIGIEQTREALRILLDEEQDLDKRLNLAKATYGSDAKGMFSSILYIFNSSRYAPLFKPIVRNLVRFDQIEGEPLKDTLSDYGRYCSMMKSFEKKYRIPPQLSDYVLSTWINVWEKYR